MLGEGKERVDRERGEREGEVGKGMINREGGRGRGRCGRER